MQADEPHPRRAAGPRTTPGGFETAPQWLLAGCLALQGAIFVVDLNLSTEYAVATLYIGATLLSFWLPWPRAIAGIAVTGSLFIVFGYAGSPASPAYGAVETLTNRALALLVVWWAAALAIGHQRYRAALQQSEARFRAHQARLQSILDTAPEALIAIDERGIIESFSKSAEKLFGYRADEIVGKNVSLLMPSPYREEHDGYLERYRRTGEKRIIGIGRVVSGRRKDGVVFPLELSVGEAGENGGRFFTGFIRDMSARQRIEQELRQAQKMEAVGQLTGGVAHDFNNLLTVILGNMEMLEARLSEERHLELVRETRETAEHGAQLTHRLLAFGRRQPLQPKATDVGQLIKDLEPLLRRTLGETIEVRARVDERVPKVLVDANQLQNAILNLAINARDAMPAGGKLTIGVENVEIDVDYAQTHAEVRPGRYVVIAVTDTGTGMSREVQERAFEPFYTTKEVGAGSGLGLSMVYGFIKQTNGHAQIYSEPGHGTTVRLYLPRNAHERQEQTEKRPGTEDAKRARGETILVVEDEPRVRRLTVTRLRELGYEVIEAPNGPAAMALLEKTPGIDLVFTDIVMPGGMTGADLGRAVRERWPAIEILYTSGYAEQEIVKTGEMQGVEWLKKPYTAVDLARLVREVLDSRQERRS